MKVCYVLGNDVLHPFPHSRIPKEARAIMSKGHQVHVVCWARTIENTALDKVPETEEYGGIHVHRIFHPVPKASASSLKRVKAHMEAMEKASAKICQLNPEFVIFVDFNTLYAAKYGAAQGRKVLYESLEDYASMIRGAVPAPLAFFAARKEKAFVKKYVDGLVSVCNPILDRLASYSDLPRTLVMNCKDLQEYNKALPLAAEARKKFPDGSMISYIGSMGEDRGLRELAAVVEQLEEQKVFLTMGGHGSLEKEMEKRVETMKNGIWLGVVKAGDVPVYSMASDVMVMLLNPQKQSHKIAMPHKLFEAMASAKPLIAAEDTLTGGMVKKLGCGLVVPYGDLEALKKAIMELASNPEMRREMGARGRKAAEEKYNWQEQEKNLLELLATLGLEGKR
ncbi:MAG: glycosyltransferase family 4 protein [Candidatus Thermoplasmatota archaeon]|nr:glycosyltransferase family 4 protein [Candidatus Thermoplasmatota archaeon]